MGRITTLVAIALYVLLFLTGAGTARATAADDVPLADFESGDYGNWNVRGQAFGAGPARGTLPNQQPVSGFLGKGLVNSYRGGDASKGRLTSPEFKIEHRFLNFLIGGGNRPVEAAVNLIVDGKLVRSETGADDEKLDWATWDLTELAGKTATLQIVDQATGSWGHINVDQILLSDTAKAPVRIPRVVSTDVLYDETYRPQFHFTSQKGWLNDPNGLVFYKNEYHLFFQHNPLGNHWDNMTWGHAISKDLVRWQQLPHALERDTLGDIFSGSAVIDRENTAGFGRGAMVLLYTAAGGQSPMNKGKPFTQCLAYSTDGRTFTKYDRNPVLPHVAGDNRDPKVFWYAPTRHWIMALYVDVKENGKTVNTVQFFGSPDLKEWTFLSRLDDLYECPDLFELAIDGDAAKTRWVHFGADGAYWLGTFDGQRFVPDGGKSRSDWGKNFYAAQTYSDIPKEDGRRILVGWMRDGKYPGMPFNQQMTFPVELSLRTTPDGVRLCKWPVKEIERLVASTRHVDATPLKPGDDPLKGFKSEPCDLETTIDVGDATSVGFDIAGTKVNWTRDGRLHVGSSSAPMAAVDGKISLRVLVDRTSIEVFGHRGEVTLSSCVLPRDPGVEVRLFVEGGSCRLLSLTAQILKSAWN